MTNYEWIKLLDKNTMAQFINLTRPSCNEYCKDAKSGCSFDCKHGEGKDVIRKWLDEEVGYAGKI